MTINPLIAAKPSFRAAVRRAAVAACLVAASAPAALADTSEGGDIHPPGLPCGYTVEVIERPECPGPSNPSRIWIQGLNNDGTVVGYRDDCVDSYQDIPWIWQPGDTTPTDIPVPPDVYSARAYDVNDHGVVCGEFKHETGPWWGFVYDTNTGEWTELEPIDPTGSGTASANAINNAGVVAGTRSIGESHQPYNAFTWSPDDGYTDLGVMIEPGSRGTDINERGDVSGYAGPLVSPDQRGFIWHDGTLSILDSPSDAESTIAHSINESRMVAGALWFDQNHAKYSPQAGSWHEGNWSAKAMPSMCDKAGALAINDDSIVGGSCTGGGQEWAVLWVNNGHLVLDSAAIHNGEMSVERVRALNHGGVVLARGKDGSTSVGLVLTPIATPFGDLTGDCEVGSQDLGILLSEWGNSDSPADFTGNGTVGGADLGILLSNWTQ